MGTAKYYINLIYFCGLIGSLITMCCALIYSYFHDWFIVMDMNNWGEQYIELAIAIIFLLVTLYFLLKLSNNKKADELLEFLERW